MLEPLSFDTEKTLCADKRFGNVYNIVNGLTGLDFANVEPIQHMPTSTFRWHSIFARFFNRSGNEILVEKSVGRAVQHQQQK